MGVDRQSLSDLERAITDTPNVTIVGSTTSAPAAVRAIASSRPEVALFPEDAIDFGRMVAQQIPDLARTVTARAAAIRGSNVAIELKAVQSGLDGVVDISQSPSDLGRELDAVRRRIWTPRHQETLEALGGEPALLTRTLSFDNGVQLAVADLVAYGLTDEQIAGVLGLDVQQIRNRISEILSLNSLSHRTQIAVLRIMNRKLPLLADE